MKKQSPSTRSKANGNQERLIARENFQYVTINPKKYGAASTRNERQLAEQMNSLHVQQHKRLAKLSSQIHEVKVHQWKLKEMDESSRDPRTTEEKVVGFKTEEESDVLERSPAVYTRGRIGKHSNTRGQEGFIVDSRKNKPLASKDLSKSSKALHLNTNGKIYKHDRTNGHAPSLRQTKPEYHTIIGPVRQSLAEQGVSIGHGLKNNPSIRRDENVLKYYKYKSYNLISVQDSMRERLNTPRERSKHILKRHGNELAGRNDTRGKMLLNQNHIGKINTRPDVVRHMTKNSQVDPANHDHRTHVGSLGLSNGHSNELFTHTNHTTEARVVHVNDGSTVRDVESSTSDEDTGRDDQRSVEEQEDWAETLKSCRYLRRPRGYETPEISIESIFQND